ncbi:MAG: PucR family transcriptional regulator [Trueperaceae bacterium]
MRCRDLLELPALSGARIVGGTASLDRDVRWVHVIDNPDAATWARPGQLVLTTGYAWPRDEAALRRLFLDLAGVGVVALGIAVPQFYDRMPAVVVEAEDDHRMVLIEVPWEVPFAQITEEVHTALLGEQTRAIERSEAIHRALTRAATSAASLDVLARTLAAETGQDVAIVGSHGDVLAATGDVGSRGWDDAVARAAWTVRTDVVVQGASVAAVWLLGHEGEPGALERRAVEHAALVTALRLAHQREIGTVESRLRRSFVDDLLEGRVDGTGLVAERAQMAGFSGRTTYRVAVAELGLSLPLSRDGFMRREEALERVRSVLVRAGASDLMTTTSNRVFVLLPDAFDAADLWRSLDDPGARMVVSRPHVGMEGVRRAFGEARASLPHVLRGTWAPFEELLLPRSMRGDRDAQRALIERFVGPLQAAASGDRLVATAFALARTDFVLKATAEALGVHISTLRHRLERIEDLLGLDLHDPDVRLRLRIAAYLSGLET